MSRSARVPDSALPQGRTAVNEWATAPPGKLTELRLTRMIADWLVAWADDKTPEERRGGASRYPIPAWAESERLASAVFDVIRENGVNTRSKPDA